jgi:3-hydroxyisobutyrate dehydrogenase-like beta-hydroxyacid dehydrogenase
VSHLLVLAVQVVMEAQAELPVTGAAAQLHAQAGEQGLEDRDMAVLFQLLRNKASKRS